MAYDLLTRKQVGRSWSRGDWASDAVVSHVEKKIPWTPIAIGAGVIGLLLLLPSSKKKGVQYHRRGDGWTEPTMRIPKETIEEIRRSDPERVYRSRHAF